MIKHLLILGLMAVAVSCDKKESNISDTELIGAWELIEVLNDPGNGKGRFEPVQSDKYILFHSNGTVSSNSEICDMSTDAVHYSFGTYSVADSTISADDCNFKIKFVVKESVLYLSYPCIEPCGEKYIRK